MALKAATKRYSSLRDAAAKLEAYTSKPLKAVFLARGVEGLTQLVDRLEPQELERALAAETQVATLLTALALPSAAGLVQPAARALAPARLRGIVRRDQLLAAEGGTLSTAEVATRLALSPQAVAKRRAAGKLLALELGRRGLRFPAWQFTDAGVLAGLDQVLSALAAHPPLAQLRFFLAGNLRLAKRRPLDVLRAGDVALVVRAAQVFGEHGAA